MCIGGEPPVDIHFTPSHALYRPEDIQPWYYVPIGALLVIEIIAFVILVWLSL